MNTYLPYQSLKLEDVIETNPPTFHSEGKVIEAIAQMNHNSERASRRFSYVLILEESKLIGILTEPDIVRLTATEIDLATTKVNEVMTTKLITLKKSDYFDIHTMLTIMRQHQIRHLPIVDDCGRLQGMVSVHSICSALHPSNLLKFRRVDEAITTQVLKAPITTSVLNLSQIMAENKSSCIVIVKNQKSETVTEFINDTSNVLSIPVGIVTERDIVQFQMLGLDLANTIAQTVMSTPLICLKTNDSLMQVREQMEKLRVRRLVIVGEQGELQGMITQFNMLRVLDPAELFGVIETLQSELDKKISQLQQEKELAQITLQSIGDGVITTDARGKIVNFNPMTEKLIGWKLAEVKGQILSDIFCLVDEQTRKPVPNLVEKVLQKNKVSGLGNYNILIARDATEYAIENSVAPIICKDTGQTIGVVIVFRDVTESRHLTNKLSWQASHDALTGLYNRREFRTRLTKAISSAQKQGYRHALCYLDLDRFKIVNDTCGHVAGDELLKQVTTLILQQVRSSDILARLGGDEFGFLLNQCPLEIGIKIANNLRQWIEDFRFSWEGRTFAIGVSIGLVEINNNTENLSTLMSAADEACYVAKAQGRNCIHVYQDNDVELSKNLGQRQWIIKLNQALDEDRFCLYSQKIVPIQGDLKPERYEILLRLHNEQEQLISPGAFIPAAERYDLMPVIDRWVIHHFMSSYNSYCQKSENNQISLCNRIYAINLSGASINSKRFRLFLKEQFDRFQIYPATICFEITETAAISNLTIAENFIRELKEIGCSIALDDFGSGMSSLTYLENLSVDYLKIDGSFVKKIVNNRVARATVEYFNQIARIMEIETIAEFVENEAILQQLKDIGIDYAQGYSIARPRPLVFS